MRRVTQVVARNVTCARTFTASRPFIVQDADIATVAAAALPSRRHGMLSCRMYQSIALSCAGWLPNRILSCGARVVDAPEGFLQQNAQSICNHSCGTTPAAAAYCVRSAESPLRHRHLLLAVRGASAAHTVVQRVAIIPGAATALRNYLRIPTTANAYRERSLHCVDTLSLRELSSCTCLLSP